MAPCRPTSHLPRLGDAIPEILAGHKQDPTRKFHVVGGTKEMISVLNDLSNLYSGKIAERWTGVDGDELGGFCETPLGSVYSPLVTIVERLNGSVGGIIAGLRNCEARPEDADLILSTAAHRQVAHSGGASSFLKSSRTFEKQQRS
ncbi:MAG: hypothetical protein EPN30_06575 [Actinomycetota bacterium]|nr:MAG: hypothetical protein EPN30_06575 [Actinomycetota bacterium]